MKKHNDKPPKLLTWQEARSKREGWLDEGEKVVFTNGCFDLLHTGHVHLLKEAASLGDRLIVAINSDKSVRRIKGKERPLRPEIERAEIIGGLTYVDGVVIFEQDDPFEIIKLLQPDVLVKGGDWKSGNIVGADIVKTSGGGVVVIPLVADRSTTALVEDVRRLRKGKTGCRKSKITLLAKKAKKP